MFEGVTSPYFWQKRPPRPALSRNAVQATPGHGDSYRPCCAQLSHKCGFTQLKKLDFTSKKMCNATRKWEFNQHTC